MQSYEPIHGVPRLVGGSGKTELDRLTDAIWAGNNATLLAAGIRIVKTASGPAILLGDLRRALNAASTGDGWIRS